MLKIVVFIVGLLSVATANNDQSPDLSQALVSVGKALKYFVNSQTNDVKISDGVHLVSTTNPNEARAATDDTFLGAIQNFLQSHEVRIKLPELLPNGREFGRAFKESIDSFDGDNDIGTARGKNKGGGGGTLLLLGSMFGSMLGALGLGGVGLLAMKALAVSAMALMLAAIVGIKKLASGHDEGGHHVIHAEGHHHRRKREAADLAYRGWL